MPTEKVNTLPVHTVRHRRLKAAIWRNQTDKGSMYNVTVTRSYKDKTSGQWHDSSSLGYDNLFRGHRPKQVDADGIFVIRRVEIDEVFTALGWNGVQQVVCQIAVRVNHPHATTGGNVLNDQIAKEGRLARSRLADNIGMVPPIVRRESERYFFF